MTRAPQPLTLLLALLSLCLAPLHFPSIRFITFAPYLCAHFDSRPFSRMIWAAALSGLLVDLSSSGTPTGLLSLTYAFTCIPFYFLRKSLKNDGIFALSLHTILYSALFSFSFLIISPILGSSLPSLSTCALSALVMPLVDGLYAFFWFTCPLTAYTLITKRKRSAQTNKRGYIL